MRLWHIILAGGYCVGASSEIHSREYHNNTVYATDRTTHIGYFPTSNWKEVSGLQAVQSQDGGTIFYEFLGIQIFCHGAFSGNTSNLTSSSVVSFELDQNSSATRTIPLGNDMDGQLYVSPVFHKATHTLSIAIPGGVQFRLDDFVVRSFSTATSIGPSSSAQGSPLVSQIPNLSSDAPPQDDSQQRKNQIMIIAIATGVGAPAFGLIILLMCQSKRNKKNKGSLYSDTESLPPEIARPYIFQEPSQEQVPQVSTSEREQGPSNQRVSIMPPATHPEEDVQTNDEAAIGRSPGQPLHPQEITHVEERRNEEVAPSSNERVSSESQPRGQAMDAAANPASDVPDRVPSPISSTGRSEPPPPYTIY